MSNISKNLRKMREAKGLSQEKLARMSDVANNTIIKIESGKNQNPTLDTLKKIAKALDIGLDELTK
jgi:transcriptional regulator with XRE-family HTH domain